MEFLIFAVMSVFAFLLLLFNQRLPLGIVNGIIAGFIFLLLGLFVCVDGISVGSVNVFDMFTQAIGVIYIVTGVGNAINSALYMKER